VVWLLWQRKKKQNPQRLPKWQSKWKLLQRTRQRLNCH
jgi:hypothetical protein